MDKIIFLTILSFAAGRVHRSGDNHDDGHDDQCIDISRYLPVQYTVKTPELCSYKLDKACTRESKEICLDVDITECDIVAFPECEDKQSTQLVRDDTLQDEHFTQQVCNRGKKFLTEVKKMPVCRTLTKQQCDSTWVVDEQGEKVWAGNENCQDVSWEDCTLEDQIVTQDVEVWECNPGRPTVYQVPVVHNVEVTITESWCKSKAKPKCSTTKQRRCKTVEWQDCAEKVIPNCNRFTVKVPYQEFDHRLRCAVKH